MAKMERPVRACTYYEHKGGKTGPGGVQQLLCHRLEHRTLQGTRPIVRTLHFALAKASGIFPFSQVLLPIKLLVFFSRESLPFFHYFPDLAAKQPFFSIENLGHFWDITWEVYH